MSYTPVGWKDYPEKTTPTSAANLNKMESGIVNNDAAITELQELVAEQAEEIEALKEENSELNNALEWKLAGTATGKTEITLPSDFKELLVVIMNGLSTKRFTLSIPRLYLTSEEQRFLTGNGIYLTGYQLNFISVYASTTTLRLDSFRESADTVITDNTNSAVTSVYYR